MPPSARPHGKEAKECLPEGVRIATLHAGGRHAINPFDAEWRRSPCVATPNSHTQVSLTLWCAAWEPSRAPHGHAHTVDNLPYTVYDDRRPPARRALEQKKYFVLLGCDMFVSLHEHDTYETRTHY